MRFSVSVSVCAYVNGEYEYILSVISKAQNMRYVNLFIHRMRIDNVCWFGIFYIKLPLLVMCANAKRFYFIILSWWLLNKSNIWCKCYSIHTQLGIETEAKKNVQKMCRASQQNIVRTFMSAFLSLSLFLSISVAYGVIVVVCSM